MPDHLTGPPIPAAALAPPGPDGALARFFAGTGGADAAGPRASAVAPPGRVGIPRDQLDELVDEVVDRIEQRVVDELERRGRRLTPGAF
jgi:hypothetical protein